MKFYILRIKFVFQSGGKALATFVSFARQKQSEQALTKAGFVF